MINKLQQLQDKHDKLEKEVGDVQEVIVYLIQCKNGRHQTFAYTDKMPEEQTFEFKDEIDGKEVSVHLTETSVSKLLEDNPKVDELRKVKAKIKKIEDLLEE